MRDLSQRLSAALADRYRVERELGRGGMATVYLACYLYDITSLEAQLGADPRWDDLVKRIGLPDREPVST